MLNKIFLLVIKPCDITKISIFFTNVHQFISITLVIYTFIIGLPIIAQHIIVVTLIISTNTQLYHHLLHLILSTKNKLFKNI